MSMYSILIVDDNGEVLEVLEIYLREARYDVYKVSDGLQALKTKGTVLLVKSPLNL
ncbi:response regulator [Anaerovirgula multivorans]|uniref:hypothetical protein n=1 Tax=Anaerovirgula multivorans TaxID=312168 RepID=UPI0015950665|nr:hypothetical protein [Anaerovirgula multivorans]